MTERKAWTVVVRVMIFRRTTLSKSSTKCGTLKSGPKYHASLIRNSASETAAGNSAVNDTTTTSTATSSMRSGHPKKRTTCLNYTTLWEITGQKYHDLLTAGSIVLNQV